MFATAGWPAAWFVVTQLMPAMTPDVAPLPEQSSTRTATRRDALGDAVRRAADRAGDVRAVAVAVVGRAAVDRVVARGRAAAELRVA